MVGIDPASDGLARATRLGVPIIADGVEGLIALDGFDNRRLVGGQEDMITDIALDLIG